MDATPREDIVVHPIGMFPRPLPKPLIGYGAYNLCFDSMLGRFDADGPTFFAQLRRGKWPVNLCKVIVFRNPEREGLTADRALPPYVDGAVSQAFLDNLQALVDDAAQQDPPFFVQVCIFHHHAVKYEDEAPAAVSLPPDLVPDYRSARLGNRLLDWFNPGPSTRLELQKELVRMVGNALLGRDNVIWELVNEVRIEGFIDTGDTVAAATARDRTDAATWY